MFICDQTGNHLYNVEYIRDFHLRSDYDPNKKRITCNYDGDEKTLGVYEKTQAEGNFGKLKSAVSHGGLYFRMPENWT